MPIGDGTSRRFHRADTLTAEPVLPEFRVPVADLFSCRPRRCSNRPLPLRLLQLGKHVPRQPRRSHVFAELLHRREAVVRHLLLADLEQFGHILVRPSPSRTTVPGPGCTTNSPLSRQWSIICFRAREMAADSSSTRSWLRAGSTLAAGDRPTPRPYARQLLHRSEQGDGRSAGDGRSLCKTRS